jgi:hypothetical protein
MKMSSREIDSLSNEHASLLSLLSEYSDKLRAISRSYYERKTRLLTWGVVSALGSIVLAAFALFALLFEKKEAVDSAYLISLVTGATAAIATMMFVFISVRSFSDRDQVAEFEIVPLQNALRRLLVRASKLESQSISNPDERILFDLRLAEAESALALSDWVLSTRQSPFIISGSRRVNSVKAARQRRPEFNSDSEETAFTRRKSPRE